MVIWIVTLATGLALLIYLAGAGAHWLHLFVAAAISLVMAVLAVRESNALVAQGESRHRISAVTARNMGLIWAWGVIALVGMYGTGVLRWKEWWQFTLAFAAAAVLSLVFAQMLARRAEAGAPPAGLLRASRWLSLVQAVGMVAVIVGLLLDGKMDFSDRDWAANNVFFFGSAALIVLSLVALVTERRLAAASSGRAPGST